MTVLSDCNNIMVIKTCKNEFKYNRRFPRSMRSQGERPGCGSHVKRVDTEMLSTHDVALRNVDGSLFHVQI